MPDDFGEIEETFLARLRRRRPPDADAPIYTIDGKILLTPRDGRMVRIKNRTLQPSTLERAVEDPHASPRHVLRTLGTWSRHGLLVIALWLGLTTNDRTFLALAGIVWGFYGCSLAWWRLSRRIFPSRVLSCDRPASRSTP